MSKKEKECKKEKLTLDKTHEALCREWHPTKNVLSPSDVTAGSNKKVWWLLPYDDPQTGRHHDLEWEEIVNNRANKGYGCPYLTGRRTWPGLNDICTTHEGLMREWDWERNEGIDPTTISAGKNIKVWWILPYYDKTKRKWFVFRWQAAVIHRALRGEGCPFPSNKKVWPTFNDLATTHPHLLCEWDYENNTIAPTEITAGSEKIVWWIVYYEDARTGETKPYRWKARVYSRAQGRGCPLFANKRDKSAPVGPLSETHPDLLKEWNYEKNKGIDPTKITAGSGKKVWWMLPYDDPILNRHFDLEWQAAINNRASGQGCPYLSGKAVLPEFNSLSVRRPDLVLEWHPTKNLPLLPTQVAEFSNKKVWWQIEVDGEIYEWPASIVSRARTGCTHPALQESKLEKLIGEILSKYNVHFEKQKSYKDCVSSRKGGKLQYDFFLEDDNIMIEGDGEQHFEVVKHFGGKKRFDQRIENDNTKSAYCFSHHIPLLRIPYIYDPIKDYDKIEELVLTFIKTKTIPQEIVDFYAQFKFSDYAKLATEYQNGNKDEQST